MKKLLARLLVVMMVLTTMIPAVSFGMETESSAEPGAINEMNGASIEQQVAPPEAPPSDITLIVKNGGIAIGSNTYLPGNHILSPSAIGTIHAYSNAGYMGKNGKNTYTIDDATSDIITVSFSKEADVYNMPSYVIDGYFSGLKADGTDINTGHDPKGDKLAATMIATPNKSVYGLSDLGTTATVTLNVNVTDGDGNTKKLNEVDFYENQNTSNFQTFAYAPTATPVIFTTTIPTSESALIAAGFIMTNDDTNKIYTKTLHYDLVDRYDGEDAAAILAQATATLVVKIKRDVNLWVASDDHAEVYIDGSLRATNNTYSTSTKYSKYVVDDSFVAAKAWDTDGTANIAGFKLVLEKNAKNGYLTTGSNWYYYYSTNSALSVPLSNGGKEWYQKNYSGAGWLPVTNILGNAIDGNWAKDTEFPTTATWIWTPEFKYSTGNNIDSPIYLRSMAPITYTVIYDNGSQNAFADVSYPNLVLGVATPAAPEMTIPEGYEFAGWSPKIAPTVTGSVTYVAQWKKVIPQYNLWVASDDYSEVYLNSNPTPVTTNASNGHYYSQVQKYLVTATETPFVAAKAWDTAQVISGFKLVLMKDNDKGYLTTNNVDWYYYTGENGPSKDVNGKEWFEESYVGEGWQKVTSDITPHTAWTADSQFPSAGAIWIWSPNYQGSSIDTPVYLRSMPPVTPVEETTTYTVTYDLNIPDASDNIILHTGLANGATTPVAPTTNRTGYTFTGWNPTITDTVTKDVTYTAIWTENGVTPEPTPQPNRPNRPTPTPVGPDSTIIDEPVALVPAPVVIEDQPTALADDPNVPQTNDSNNILLLLGLLLGSGAGITAISRRKVNAGK